MPARSLAPLPGTFPGSRPANTAPLPYRTARGPAALPRRLASTAAAAGAPQHLSRNLPARSVRAGGRRAAARNASCTASLAPQQTFHR